MSLLPSGMRSSDAAGAKEVTWAPWPCTWRKGWVWLRVPLTQESWDGRNCCPWLCLIPFWGLSSRKIFLSVKPGKLHEIPPSPQLQEPLKTALVSPLGPRGCSWTRGAVKEPVQWEHRFCLSEEEKQRRVWGCVQAQPSPSARPTRRHFQPVWDRLWDTQHRQTRAALGKAAQERSCRSCAERSHCSCCLSPGLSSHCSLISQSWALLSLFLLLSPGLSSSLGGCWDEWGEEKPLLPPPLEVTCPFLCKWVKVLISQLEKYPILAAARPTPKSCSPELQTADLAKAMKERIVWVGPWRNHWAERAHKIFWLKEKHLWEGTGPTGNGAQLW